MLKVLGGLDAKKPFDCVYIEVPKAVSPLERSIFTFTKADTKYVTSCISVDKCYIHLLTIAECLVSKQQCCSVS